MLPFRRLLLISLTLSAGLFTGCQTPSVAAGGRAGGVPRVHVYETNGVVRVDLDGRLFTEYHHRGVSRPFLYPLLTSGDRHMTRRWPMEEAPGEERDHPHHRSFWYAHGDANGVDLWSEAREAGKTVHQAFVRQESGDRAGVIASRNEWRDKDGRVLATDERTHRFLAPDGDVRIIDFEITIHASHGDLVLGDTKEGSFALRVAESMRVKQPRNHAPGTGVLVNSRGDRQGDAWGKRAEWADYSGPVGDAIFGVAIFDHPGNPRFPTWWHARDYGLFAANPFGIHDFEKRGKGAGDFRIASGGSATFRYRVVFHPGDATEGRIAERYAAYVAGAGAGR